jgi:bile acid-coenzyme A ligase
MTTALDGAPSYGARLGELARERPDHPALIFVTEEGDESTIGFAELERRSNQVARALARRGLGQDDLLAVALHNSPEHLYACFGAWKLGAVPVPMRWDLPEWERGRVLDAMAPQLVVGEADAALFADSLTEDDGPLEDRIAPHGWGVCSGGSTGTPKVILQRFPGVHFGGPFNHVVEQWRSLSHEQRVLVPAPLYHTNGFTIVRNVLFGQTSILLQRFGPELLLDAIERHRVTGFIAATPFLQRIAKVEGVGDRDFSSIEWIQQGAAPLPVWLGRRICELIGPEQFFMSFGASEGLGLVVCRGDEYLERPGTLGRPLAGEELKILDDELNELPNGEIGLIFQKNPMGPSANYLGKGVAQMTVTEDGFATVGDLGWVDEDGWVYLADRRVDMIVTGGANVYPAEVEAALSEHPGVADVVVIGLPDEEWGHRVHAIVQPSEGEELAVGELIAFSKERVAHYKAPKSVELIEVIPRAASMKINRSALVAERLPSGAP